MYIFSQ